MIISRQQFELNKKCVIEKLIIKTPFRYGAIFQDEACFLYFKNGSTTITSPTQKTNIISTESVLLKCGNYFADFIKNSKNDTCEVYAIHLYPEILNELYKDELPSFLKENEKGNFIKKIIPSTVVHHFIEGLTFYFENPNLLHPEIIILKLKELILLLLQTENSETILNLFSFLFNPLKVNLLELIEAHVYSDFTITQLASLAGMSLSTFKRNFHIHFNDTPANYIKTKKITKAAELLTNSHFSISEIAFKIGFNDLSHFTRSFHRFYNCSPTSYREKTANQ